MAGKKSWSALSGGSRSFQGRSGPSTVVIRQPSGVPDRLFTKLVYEEALALTSTSGSPADNLYRGNSVFDPNLTGGGHQPYFADQWAAMYSNYFVHASKIEVMFYNNNTALPQASVICGIVPSTVSTTFAGSSYELNREQPYGKWAQIGINPQMAMVKGYMSSAKMFAVDPKGISIENDYGALTTANPNAQWYWHVTLCAADGSSTAGGFARVKVTYFVEYALRQRPAQS